MELGPLHPPDGFHVQVAQGWLELGNPIEADAELGKITPTSTTRSNGAIVGSTP